MSIEETYKGMWSSDPSLLKSLLDAGETIICKDPQNGLMTWEDCGYWLATKHFPAIPRSYSSSKDNPLGFEFLIPPRPLVLEPKPLRWCMWDAFSSNLKARDEWRTSTGLLASGRIRYTVESRDGRHYWRIFPEGDYVIHAHGYCDTQEDAINKIEKWRKDHLEMPVFKCESEPMVEPKPLEWKQNWNGEIATDGKWRYHVQDGGCWEVWCDGKCGRYRIGEGVVKNGGPEKVKAAIKEWRVNHLKSMLP